MSLGRRLTEDQRKFIVLVYPDLLIQHELLQTAYDQLIVDFQVEFPGEKPPSRAACQRLLEKVDQTGTVADRHKNRRKTVATPENVALVRQLITADPTLSSHKGVKKLRLDYKVKLNRTTWRKIVESIRTDNSPVSNQTDSS